MLFRSRTGRDAEITGRVDAMINFVSSSLPQVQSGKLRGLAVATATRLEVAPDLPTMAEAGVPGVEVSSWAGLMVPAKTPRDIIAKLHADTLAAIADPAVKANMEKGGIVLVGSTPDELGAFLRAEVFSDRSSPSRG